MQVLSNSKCNDKYRNTDTLYRPFVEIQIVYKKYYSLFLAKHPGELHFTAHSHHFWPDVSRDAVLRYWEDSSRLVDDKWPWIFEHVIAPTRELVARMIGSESPEQIVFGTNTHEFICRLISCFETDARLSVLTTDSEFHSFSRQIRRLKEANRATVEIIPVEPFTTFHPRFTETLSRKTFDLVFLSQVFFNSGRAISGLDTFMADIIRSARSATMIVLDGYHAFCALPTRIAPFADRVFYLAGGYKYAQAGEGACFLHSPPGCELRPVNTGWFANFEGLSGEQNPQVEYSRDGNRFAGSTFDPSGIYRLRAVLELFETLDLDCEKIHAHVVDLQARFIDRLDEAKHPQISHGHLLYDPELSHGHFLTFCLESEPQTARLHGALKKAGIHTDYRGNRIRFGFGLYHDTADIDEFFRRLPKA